MTCFVFSIEFAKTNQKIVENSEICENYVFLLVNCNQYFSFVSLPPPWCESGGAKLERVRAEFIEEQVPRALQAGLLFKMTFYYILYLDKNMKYCSIMTKM